MPTVTFSGGGHSGSEVHHYYRQAAAPTGADPLQVGDLWSDTTANLLKRCTSLSPVTFVSVEGGSAAHDILSATHGDSLTGTVARGDLIIGNATPKFARVAIGASGRVLRSDGTDPSWSQLAHADLASVTADQHHAQAHAIDGADHTGTLTVAKGGTAQTAAPVVEMPISAASLRGTVTAGAGDANGLPERAESTTNKVNYDYIAFDPTTEENAYFTFIFPKGWNEGTITFRVAWTNTGGLTTETVVFGLKAIALSNDDAIDTAFGAEVTVTDTWLAQDDEHTSPESTAMTIGGAPAAGDEVHFNIARKTASDNLTGDARLKHIVITFTRDTYTDA